MPYTITNGLFVPDALAGAAITGGTGLGADTYVNSTGPDSVVSRPMSTFAWSPRQTVRGNARAISQGGRYCRASEEPLPIGLWCGYAGIPTDRGRNVSATAAGSMGDGGYNFVGQLRAWSYPEDTTIKIVRHVRFYGEPHRSWAAFVTGRKSHGKHEVVFVFDNRLPHLAHIELDESAGAGAVPWLDNMFYETPEQLDLLNEVADILVAEGLTESAVYSAGGEAYGDFTFYKAMPRARFEEGAPCAVDLDGERCVPNRTGPGCLLDHNENPTITHRGTPGTQAGDKQRRYPRAERRCRILENCPVSAGAPPRRLANDPVAPCRHTEWNAVSRAYVPPGHRPGTDGRGEIMYARQWGTTNVVANAYINRILNRAKWKHVYQHLVDGGGLVRGLHAATFSLSGMFSRMVDHVSDTIQERVRKWSSDPWALVTDIGFGVMCGMTGGATCTLAYLDACVGVGCAAVGISEADGDRWLRLGNAVAAAASGDISGVLSVRDLPALNELNRNTLREAVPLFNDIEGIVGSGARRPRDPAGVTGARMAGMIRENSGLLDAVRAHRSSLGNLPFITRELAPNRHIQRGRSDLDLALVWRHYDSGDWVAAASIAQIMVRRELLRVANSRDSQEFEAMKAWGVYDWQRFAVASLGRWWQDTNGYPMPDFHTVSISDSSMIWAESAVGSVTAGIKEWMSGIRAFAGIRRQISDVPLERLGTVAWRQRIAAINTALRALQRRQPVQYQQAAMVMQASRDVRRQAEWVRRLQSRNFLVPENEALRPQGVALLRKQGTTTTRTREVQAAFSRALQAQAQPRVR